MSEDNTRKVITPSTFNKGGRNELPKEGTQRPAPPVRPFGGLTVGQGTPINNPDALLEARVDRLEKQVSTLLECVDALLKEKEPQDYDPSEDVKPLIRGSVLG